MYADDTNIFFSGSNINETTNTFNTDLASLTQYLKCNRLSLNISKTHSMLFSLNNTLHDTKLSLVIDGAVIDTVKTTTFLGVKIDNKLTFDEHLVQTCNKSISCGCEVIDATLQLFDMGVARSLKSTVVQYSNW
ncbi:hypothetical protein CAPTEDRAFT_211968 [Capitella teleta]|uniref:Reverse transcriptase domain-containing protein n=1 Tax=Capitella teleta TaxID=283909 RepID=R7TQG0_CAPTE|nr:hypothetical protein CAPTEDRAFT_211968 [Capitella teleta]|eukprot:ELT93265.1 hypothetical protein CAPTEDRAFT_211968 [Capitella teleta]